MSSTSKYEVAAIAFELLKRGHTELYKVSKAWKRYISLRKESNAVLLDGQKMVPATLVSCKDPDLLEHRSVWKRLRVVTMSTKSLTTLKHGRRSHWAR
jgi:hypothetical protein